MIRNDADRRSVGYQLDFAIDHDDRWWFQRCCPDGRWARVQQETGLPVAAALAAALRGPGRG